MHASDDPCYCGTKDGIPVQCVAGDTCDANLDSPKCTKTINSNKYL